MYSANKLANEWHANPLELSGAIGNEITLKSICVFK